MFLKFIVVYRFLVSILLIEFINDNRDGATATEFEAETDGSGTAVDDDDDEQLMLPTSVITSPKLERENVKKN